MTTFGKLTRFNFSKQKYNTTSIFLFFFAIYNSIISKYSKTKQNPLPRAGIKMRCWSHTKVNAENRHSSHRPQVFHLNTLLILFLSQFVKVCRKFFKIISSQTPGFFNDTQLHEICVSIWLLGIKSNFCLFW